MPNANTTHRDSLTWCDRAALWLVRQAGSPWFFTACVVLCLLPLVSPATLPAVQFASSGFLQLVFLPLLLISQNLQARHDAHRADAHYAAERHMAREMDALRADVAALRACLESHDAEEPTPDTP